MRRHRALRHCLEREGVEAGDRVGIMLPNIAAVPIIYYGILAAGRDRGPDEPAHAGPRGGVLPCKHRREGADSAPPHLPPLRPRAARRPVPWCRSSMTRDCRACSTVCPEFGAPVERADSDTARRPAHLRHDREAEGCRADARQPRQQPGRRRSIACEADRKRCRARLAYRCSMCSE